MQFRVLSGGGYYFRQASLKAAEQTSFTSDQTGSATSTTSSSTSALGDLSSFKIIVQDTLNFVNKGDIPGANNRVNDLEHDWDAAQSRLKSKNLASWSEVDGKIDTVLRDLRSTNPSIAKSKASLEALLATLQ